MSNYNQLAIIICQHQQFDVTLECLQSLALQVEYLGKIFLVDDGSSKFNQQYFSNQLPLSLNAKIEWIVLDNNLGYAQAANRGLSAALAHDQYNWFLLLNNDTELRSDFLKNFFAATQSFSKAKIFSGSALNFEQTDQIDSLGLTLTSDGMATALGQNALASKMHSYMAQFWLPAAVAVFYQQEVLKRVGLYDPRFESYCEDVDLALRAWHQGYDAIFLPQCQLKHKRSVSFGKFSLKKLYLVERNHFGVIIKNFPWPWWFLMPLLTACRYGHQLLALIFKKGMAQNLKAESYSLTQLILVLLKAHCDALLRFCYFYKQRKFIMNTSVRSTSDFIKALKRNRIKIKDYVFNQI